MRIGLQTWGSRGDVAPFIALASALAARGHRVTLAVTTDDSVDYSSSAAAGGFDLRIAGGDFEHAPVSTLHRIVRTADRLEQVRLLNAHYFDPAVPAIFDAAQALCADNDIVIGHFWLHPLLTAAELAGVPRVPVHFSPIGIRSGHVPAAGPNLGRWLNGLVWDLGDRLTSRKLFHEANALRVRHGLAPVTSLQRELFVSADLTLLAASPVLCPRQPDWPDSIHVTGHFAPAAPAGHADVADELGRFLAAGEPPVFFTFGSCDLFFGPANIELFTRAAALAGVRAIVQTLEPALPAGGPADTVRFVREVDHRRVFPRCSVVVHHGGAGTTHSTLAAGKPSVVVAHGFDQPQWARALAAAGIAAGPLHRRSVTPRRLARSIRRLLDEPGFAARAARAGARFAGESGVDRAAGLIESKFSPLPPR